MPSGLRVDETALWRARRSLGKRREEPSRFREPHSVSAAHKNRDGHLAVRGMNITDIWFWSDIPQVIKYQMRKKKNYVTATQKEEDARKEDDDAKEQPK